jgi:hypothetical protein
MDKHDTSVSDQPNSEPNMNTKARGVLVLLVCNVFVAACTLLLAIFALGQLYLMQDTATRQLRAYVTGVRVEVHGRGPICVHVIIKNSGQTPAKNVRVKKVYVSWRPIEAGAASEANPTKILPECQAVLASGQEFCLIPNCDDVNREKQKHKTQYLDVSGEIHYEDIYDVKHESTFHFTQDDKCESSEMRLAKDGNTMDQIIGNPTK